MHSILLIKSVNDDSSNACCSGAQNEAGGMEAPVDFNALYKLLKTTYSSKADFHVLDPRNSFLIFVIIKDCLRFKVPTLTILKTIFTYSVPSMIIDGRLIFKGIPSSDDFKAYFETLKN